MYPCGFVAVRSARCVCGVGDEGLAGCVGEEFIGGEIGVGSDSLPMFVGYRHSLCW